MSYDYKKAKVDILETLNSKVPISDKDEIPNDESLFNFENGVKAWVGSIFVDMVDSTTFFTRNNLNDNVKARIMRSFVEQIVSIMNENCYCYDIGIRGDCVFGIFQANKQNKLVEMFRTAYCINTFMEMFNELLGKSGFQRIKAGIGIGASQEVIVKVGKKRVVNDKIWIGDAVVNASNLSKIANRNGYKSICMDPLTYSNIIDLLLEENQAYKTWITRGNSYKFGETFYQCDIIQKDFDDWICGGMK